MIHTAAFCITLFAAAFINACLSHFIHFNFREGKLLRKYFEWLTIFHARKVYKNETFWEDFQLRKPTPEDIEFLREEASKSFWYNPFGGCIVCFNIWQGFFTFWFFYLAFSLSPYFLIPYLLISNTLLRLFNK